MHSSSSSSNDVLLLPLLYSCKDYALKFPNKGKTDYTTTTTSVPDLTKFTLCFWMKSTDQQQGSPFSYCTPSSPGGNELLIFNYGSFSININDVERWDSTNNYIEPKYGTEIIKKHHFYNLRLTHFVYSWFSFPAQFTF